MLIDFWTYSCVNCLRTLPFLRGWDKAYRDKGLQIVGVHTPEFAFEHEADNVRGAVDRLGVDYAVALDNEYGTWNAYGNRYWPAKYLIDVRGHVRFVHFGEGAYAETERVIRSLLAEPTSAELVSAAIAEAMPSREATRETYLGHQRLMGLANPAVAPDRDAPYLLPGSLEPDQMAYGGRWRVEAERAVAGRNARLRLRFRAKEVNLVLGGTGRVQVSLDGTAGADRRRARQPPLRAARPAPASAAACSSSASRPASRATPSRSARAASSARACRRRSRGRGRAGSGSARRRERRPREAAPRRGSRRSAARAPRRRPASPRRSPRPR